MPLPVVGLEAVIEGMAGFEKNSRAITKSYDAIDTASNKIARSSGGLTGILSGVGGGLMTLGKVAAGAALGGTVLLGGGLAALGTKAVLSAADVGEMQSLFNTAFGQDAPKARAEIDEFAAAVGRNKFELEGFAGGIKSLLSPMGVTGDTANQMSIDFSKLAVDLSSFYNVTESDALESLRSGLIGETEPLRKFGVVLNQASIEQQALNMGIWDGKGTMDAATKANATYALVMEQTKMAQGDAARTSGSWVNQTRALKSAIDETVIEIGMELIPVLTPLLQQFTAMVKQYLPQLVKWFKDNLPKAIQAAQDAWVEIQPALDDIWKIITEDVIPAIKDIVAWFKKDVPAGSAKVQAALKPVIERVLPELIDIFNIFYKWTIKNWPLILKTIETVVNKIEYIWENWGDEIKKTVELVFKIVKVNLENMLDVVTLIMQIITGDWEGAWETIKDIAERTVGLIVDLVEASFNNMLKLIGEIMDSIKSKISDTWAAIVGIVKDKVQEVYNSVKSKFDSLASLIAGYASSLTTAAKTMMQGIIDGINSMLSSISTALSTVITNAVNSLKNSITAGNLKSLLLAAGTAIITAIKDGVTAVTDFASQLIAKIQGAINQLSSAISSGTLYNILESVGQKIVSTIRDAVTSATDFVSKIQEKLGEWFDDFLSSGLIATLKGVGEDIVREIKNGFLGAKNIFNVARDAIQDWISSWFSPIPSARLAGSEIVDNILVGFYAQRGRFIMATRTGLSDWMAQAGMGLNAVVAPSVNAPALGATGSTSIYNTFQLGGNNIYSQMDAAQFEARVLKVIRRNL